MRWSVTLGSIGGSVIRIHIIFLLLLVWIGAIYYREGGIQVAAQATILILIIFLCVLLHELGHIFAARCFGVTTRDATLWPFGGIATMERIPEKPSQEIVVALAGPAVNAVIAAALLLWLGSHFDPENLIQIDDPAVPMAIKVAGANIMLVAFNMIPALPLDGGRVLCTLLAMRVGNALATEITADIGQGFAVAFGILGIFYNPLLLIIAVFVFLAASGEAANTQLRAMAHGTLVSDAMVTEFHSLGTSATINDAIEALIHTAQTEFPVVDEFGHLLGVLAHDGIIKVLYERGASTPVLEAMQADVPTVPAQAKLDMALGFLLQKGYPVVGVTDTHDRLIGLLTVENLGEMMMVHSTRAR
jgi:Zn-dependent protease/CBS domain-containing protein